MKNKTMWLLASCVIVAALLLVSCAQIPTEEEEPVPPAEFEVTLLDIVPSETVAGETVIITAQVTNIGGSEGTYAAILTVDGVDTQTRDITLAPGAMGTVTFPLTKDTSGTYNIGVDGLSGTLRVEGPVQDQKLRAELAAAKEKYSEVIFQLELAKERVEMVLDLNEFWSNTHKVVAGTLESISSNMSQEEYHSNYVPAFKRNVSEYLDFLKNDELREYWKEIWLYDERGETELFLISLSRFMDLNAELSKEDIERLRIKLAECVFENDKELTQNQNQDLQNELLALKDKLKVALLLEKKLAIALLLNEYESNACKAATGQMSWEDLRYSRLIFRSEVSKCLDAIGNDELREYWDETWFFFHQYWHYTAWGSRGSVADKYALDYLSKFIDLNIKLTEDDIDYLMAK